jgi:hypothetical protein
VNLKETEQNIRDLHRGKNRFKKVHQLYRGINNFKKVHQPRTKLGKDDNSDLLADSHSILNR